ncbi:hypothetical protein [Roseomonas gilardii]|uniref:hypothetical protein n=1 Tax=Roseomonas gilardii TaxID=257708 RepID=UPI0004B6FE33|nr:hypothetical protein [Roseomonas gilardii]SUE44591.1 Uncharacterised protein [Roseomonas gilardii subsp. rosea]
MSIVKPATLILLATMSLAACAERTTGQKIRDTLDPPSGPAESMGRSMDRTVNSITKP